jgi:hypothetical protein
VRRGHDGGRGVRQGAEQQAAQVQGEFGRGRVVEDQGGGQGDAGGGRELVAQVDGGQ